MQDFTNVRLVVEESFHIFSQNNGQNMTQLAIVFLEYFVK